MNRAAICLVQRADGRYLCVWNKRYGGWAFPGGKVEYGESPEEAAFRELLEETWLDAGPDKLEQVFEGEHGIKIENSRGSVVHVFRVKSYKREPREMEVGCPVTWFTREEFMKWSPFASFYERVFAKLELDALDRADALEWE